MGFVLKSHVDALDPSPLVLPAAWGPYRGYRALMGELRGQVEHGGVRARALGPSALGLPLFAFDAGPPDAPRASFVIAGLHAMEWIGVEVATRLVARLAAAPPSDRLVRVVPVANVDGYRRVEARLREGRRAFDRTNARMVDLNRNWPTFWSSSHLRAKVLPFLGHGGATPTSEPEVAAITADLEGLDVPLERALSLHSFGRKVLYPFGGAWRRSPSHDAHLAAAEALAAAMPGYSTVQSSRWVPGFFAPGMEIDHLSAYFGAIAILVELGAGGPRLSDPSSWVHPFRWFNVPELERELELVVPPLERFVRGDS
ncbi:MAG: hypothetical protein KF901_05865 [Myxococcales bacterium]|nr:hypothetical protein [Myxococcales bacterium]